MSLEERRKYLRRDRLRDSIYSCPVFGETKESLHYFLGECRELRELHLEILGREIGERY